MLITLIAFDEFTDIDLFLSWDLLNRVKQPKWQVRLLGTADRHTSKSGLTIAMHGQIEESAHADAVLFGSGPATRRLIKDALYLQRFELRPNQQLIGSMRSGALLLAALGLLSGKRATTCPTAKEELRAFGVEVVDEPFVREGNIATAPAWLAGLDLGGWAVRRPLRH